MDMTMPVGSQNPALVEGVLGEIQDQGFGMIDTDNGMKMLRHCNVLCLMRRLTATRRRGHGVTRNDGSSGILSAGKSLMVWAFDIGGLHA